MKTIEFDLEKDGQLDALSDALKQQNIEVGEEVFVLKIHALYDVSQILYAGFLLLLAKYLTLEKKNPLDEVFGIWKNENITLATIRKKAWQRTK